MAERLRAVTFEVFFCFDVFAIVVPLGGQVAFYIQGMKRVGLRELKNRLSNYIRQARAGHEIEVTDRGEVVAELLPPRHAVSGGDSRRRLEELARRGLATGWSEQFAGIPSYGESPPSGHSQEAAG